MKTLPSKSHLLEESRGRNTPMILREKSLSNLANFLLTLAKALALRTNIISQHRPKDEILLRRKLAQWFGDNHTDSIQTFTLAKEKIQTVVTNRLNDIINVLTL